MSFVIIFVGVLVGGGLFSLGMLSFVRKRPVWGAVLAVVGLACFISLFVFVKDAPPIQSMD